jgi:phosphotransferase system enzyme I (PtsI)
MTISNTLKGVGVSSGIGVAPAALFQHQVPGLARKPVSVQEELLVFDQALSRLKERIQGIIDKFKMREQQQEAAIFQAHLMILDDPALVDSVRTAIQAGAGADAAVTDTMDGYISRFQQVDDPYLKERAQDMADIRDRLLGFIGGQKEGPAVYGDQPRVLVAENLAPSDTALLDSKLIAGIVMEKGGPTSHTAILARTMGIPAVVSCAGILDAVALGDVVAVDGDRGVVEVNPAAERLVILQSAAVAQMKAKKDLDRFRQVPALTTDGVFITTEVNIASDEDALVAGLGHADGVGLFRTEFLYMYNEKALPNEDEQFQAYKSVASAFGRRPVTVRTLDIGGDKDLPTLPVPKEENPYLGVRAIRLSLDCPELFMVQLRAILRASVYGKLQIMFPFITTVEELQQALALLEDAKSQLRLEGKPFDEGIRAGIMVETPAAALTADALADRCDFFSIGTNDLTQYVLCADRGNGGVSYLYDAAHPAVLRLVSMTAQAAKRHHIPCSICGEAGADPGLLPIWIGLGVTGFSVADSVLPTVRRTITQLSWSLCQDLAQKALNMLSAQEVRRLGT